jgi:hypothetical protein
MRHRELKSNVQDEADRAPPVAAGLESRLARRIEAFDPAFRAPLIELMRQSPAFEDLADSFPALLFALATNYGSQTRRKRALQAVTSGLPLREVADRLGLPMWLRKLQPAALQVPLSESPAEPGLANRLVSLIPTQPAAAAAWLERVLIAHHLGRPDLALWVAQQYRTAKPAPRSEAFLGVLAWAWFAGTGNGWRAEHLLTSRWTRELGAQRAAKEMALWRERIALDVCLGDGITDTWLAEGSAGGFEFVALRTADEFIAEALAMDNCLDRYTDRMLGRAARIFSIRQDGRRVADVEIAAHEHEPGHPTISQLRGPRNRRAPIEIWQAAYGWLGGQPLRLAEPCHTVKLSRPARLRRRARIWGPFIDALPETARATFEALFVKGSKRAPRAHSTAVPMAGEATGP